MARRNYYDIDDILAGQERVPCVLRADLDGLGSAGSGGGTSKVQRNARWGLPYWMADRLNEEDYVDMEVSPVFSKRASRMYAASPESMQLRAICQHFYQFGLQLGDMVPEIPHVLRNMYVQRVYKVARIAQQGQNVEALDFVQSLDKTEARMLKLCQQAQSAISLWHKNQAYALKRAAVVAAAATAGAGS
ncbi:DNA replication protein [Coemansia aciculifera]|uniref:DNA replication protein n=1 Tax=Coemansia aciculifera TaxID=417176 RepID=A0ACC1M8P0_9FUNG|nr:DNA replication protein [Coemansia aciculifera]